MTYSLWAKNQLASIQYSLSDVSADVKLEVAEMLGISAKLDSGKIHIREVGASYCFELKDLGFRLDSSRPSTDHVGTLKYFIALRATKFCEMLCNFFWTHSAGLDEFAQTEILHMLFHQASSLYEVIKTHFKEGFLEYCQESALPESEKSVEVDACIIQLFAKEIFGLARDYFEGQPGADLIFEMAFDPDYLKSVSRSKGGDILVALHQIKSIELSPTSQGVYSTTGFVTPKGSLESGRTKSAYSSHPRSESSVCP